MRLGDGGQKWSLEALNQIGEGLFPGLIGIEITSLGGEEVRSRLTLRAEHLAPNGFLHAAVVVALADTCCGYGCRISLPEGATGFTTAELKTNFLSTSTNGAIHCVARRVHGGRSTQVWDATVADEGSGRDLALFRCTQILFYPR